MREDQPANRPEAARANEGAPATLALLPLLPAHDLSATRDFYERELGLQVESHTPDLVSFRAGPALIAFRPAVEEVIVPPGFLVRLEVADVERLYSRLRRLGVPVEGPPRRTGGYRVYRFTVRDPDGYPLEVCTGPHDRQPRTDGETQEE